MRRWRGFVVVITLLLAGCVSLTPAQQAKVKEYQAFADRVTEHYGAPPVLVEVQDITTTGRMESRGKLLLHPRIFQRSDAHAGVRQGRQQIEAQSRRETAVRTIPTLYASPSLLFTSPSAHAGPRCREGRRLPSDSPALKELTVLSTR